MEMPIVVLFVILFAFILIFLGAGILFSEDYITFNQAIIIWTFALLSVISVLGTAQEKEKVIKTEMCQVVESTINKYTLSQLLSNKDFTCVYKNQENEIISADLKEGEYKTFISDDENFMVKEKAIDNISTHRYLFLFDFTCDLSDKDEKEYEIYIPSSLVQ